MTQAYEIRADFDKDTIVIYQAYNKAIAVPALKAQKFVPPFSFNRMTWIKPSFLWLMARSNWGQKSGQEHILAVRIKRTNWEAALGQAVLTHAEGSIYGSGEAWHKQFNHTSVIGQWDPGRSIRNGKLQHYSIQVGIRRDLIQEYAEQWITEIKDYTPIVRKIHDLLKAGKVDNAKKHLPPERPYPLPDEIGKKLGMNS